MWKREKLKSKNGYAQKYRGVSPGEEKEGYAVGRVCGEGKF